MTASLPPGLTDCLLWSEELGFGYHPRPPIEYRADYFEKYRRLDATPMGEALTRARIEFVRRHFDGPVLDIGIGGGRFVDEADAFGFDINPEAADWLRRRGKFRPPIACMAMTFWDSLEHILDPESILKEVGQWAFVSMPIYRSQADCLASKHFKPGEHIHYWTLRGLIGWFARQGFGCVEVNERESELGRQGITSFAFRRFYG